MATRGMGGKPLQEMMAEVMEFVGLSGIETITFRLWKPSALAEYHRVRGARYEHLLHEYVIAVVKRGGVG